MTGHVDLLDPVRIGSLLLRNRIAMGAHHPMYAVDCRVSQRYVEYFRARARGGAGLLVAGSLAVHPSGGTPGHVALWRREAAGDLRLLADAVHDAGGHLFGQLWHNGPQSRGNEFLDSPGPPWAASAIASGTTEVLPRSMTKDEIDTVVAAFAQGALLLQGAGIDGVELSGAHGYLIHSFLSPLTNRREDGYGGDPQRRGQLVRDIVAESRGLCGRDYPVGLRLVLDEYVGPAGIEPSSGLAVLEGIVAPGLLDYVSVSAGNYWTFHRQIPAASSGLSAPLAAHGRLVRAAVGPEVAVVLANAIRDVAVAQELIDSGAADIVAMTRAQIADPDLVAKLSSGAAAEITRCVGANQGCIRRLVEGRDMACTVNPAVGREATWSEQLMEPSARVQKVLVVGGGPAGMRAAYLAARRGHRVTLVEGATALGGQLTAAGALPDLAGWRRLVDDLSAAVARVGVEVRLGQLADRALVEAPEWSRVVLATGAQWAADGRRGDDPEAASPVVVEPGADVRTADEVSRDPASCGARVLVADDRGEALALALALTLAGLGHEVEFVTARPSLGDRAGRTGDLAWLGPRVAEAGIPVRVGAWPQRIGPGQVLLDDGHVTRIDTVVFVAARHPLHPLPGADGIDRIGDCLIPGDVDDAIVSATRWAMAL